MTYELAGPNTYTYKELGQTMCNYLGIPRMPFDDSGESVHASILQSGTLVRLE